MNGHAWGKQKFEISGRLRNFKYWKKNNSVREKEREKGEISMYSIKNKNSGHLLLSSSGRKGQFHRRTEGAMSTPTLITNKLSSCFVY